MSERRINLLFVITKLELGGAQTHLLDLIRGIDRNKFNLFLFSAREGFLVAQALKISGLKFHRSSFLERSINPLKDILALISLYFYIKHNKINLVHTHSSKAGILGRLAAKMAGVKGIIHSVHGWSFHEYQSKLSYQLFLSLEKFCARFTDTLIVVSRSDKAKGLANGVGSESVYRVIRCGLKADDFRDKGQRGSARMALGCDDFCFIVGMVACFKAQKDPVSFVKLAAGVKRVLPKVKFVLVGDGQLRAEIMRAIKDSGLEEDVILLGWRQDIAYLLSALDVFVLTSLWEGLPIAVLEAMASGIPVVVTDTGGVGEVVREGETGYLVKTMDTAAMQTKVLHLLKDKKLREDIAGRAVQQIKGDEFSLRRMTNEFDALYQELWVKHG